MNYDGFSIFRSTWSFPIEEYAINSLQVSEYNINCYYLNVDPPNNDAYYEWVVYPTSGSSLNSSGGNGLHTNHITIYTPGFYDVQCRMITPCGPTSWVYATVYAY